MATVAALTALGKVVSFAKDATLARGLGTSDAMDAFTIAFGFLTFIASVVASGVPASFLPAYVELRAQRGRRRAQRLALQSSAVHLATLLLAAGVIALLAGTLMELVARGFDPQKRQLAAQLLRGLLPFMVAWGWSIQLGAWLQAEQKFALPAAAPLLVPLSILIWLLINPRTPIEGVMWATVTGAILQAAILAAAQRAHLRGTRMTLAALKLPEPFLRKVIANAVPYLLSSLIHSSVTVVDQTMAAMLEAGSVAVLGFSDKICSIILALTSVPVGEVLFPHFAEMVAREDWAGLRRQIWRACVLVMSLVLPMALCVFVLAPWIVSVLFERGEFGPADTQRVAHVLRFAIFQVPFFILGGLLSRVLVSFQTPRVLLAVSLTAMVLNISLNALLMRWFGLAGIALSTVFVTFVLAIMVAKLVLQKITEREQRKQPPPHAA